MAYRKKFSTRRPRKSYGGRKFGAKKIGKVRGRKNVYATKGFNKAVKRVIHRMSENKVLSSSSPLVDVVACDGSTNNTAFLNLLPALQQGTAQGQRIGNQVRLVKNTIRGHIWLKDYSATTNPLLAPVMVKMWVVSWKYSNVGSGLQPTARTDYDTFFQAGSSTSNFVGNLLDMERSVNTDVWTVHATKTFMLSTAPYSSAGSPPIQYQNQQGVICHPFSFSLGKYAKSLKYNDNIAPSHPTNHSLYLIIQTVQARGQTNGTSSSFCRYSYNQDMVYEDF